MRVYINRALKRLGCNRILMKRDFSERLAQDAWRWRRVRPLAFANNLAASHASEHLLATQHIDDLRSEFGQDAFVLSQLQFKKNGYFVDFGATDGISGSNTYILEQRYGWTGILAEPARCWHDSLRRNRTAEIELSGVSDESGKSIPFYEKGDVSTARSRISLKSKLKRLTKPSRFYDVPTISLYDLLKKYRAPRVIDYLSMDTEGSELQILNAFDFSAFRFRVITCEHNHTPNREKIFALLTSHGYARVFESISEVDDWYVLRDEQASV